MILIEKVLNWFGTLEKIKSLKPLEFAELAKSGDYVILDCRSYDAFGGQHIIGSYGIDFNGNFPTFSGWVIPPEKKILLVTPHHLEAEEVAIWLRRVGLDNVFGFLEGGMFEWAKGGLPTQHICQISATGNWNIFEIVKQFISWMFVLFLNLKNTILKERSIFLRLISGKDIENLIKKRKYYVICSTGHRSTLAISILLAKGFLSSG